MSWNLIIAIGVCCTVTSAANAGSTSLDSFVAQFRVACASGNINQLQRLVWWGDTTPKAKHDIEAELALADSDSFQFWHAAAPMRRDIETDLARAVSHSIESIQVGLLPREYRDSKEMREASLPPTHELFVRYGPLEHTRFFLGRHQGRFYIVVHRQRVLLPVLLAHPQ